MSKYITTACFVAAVALNSGIANAAPLAPTPEANTNVSFVVLAVLGVAVAAFSRRKQAAK